jgi:hypothetical protein
MGELRMKTSPGKKVSKPYLKKQAGHGRTSKMGGEGRRIAVVGQPCTKVRPYLKKKLKKKGLEVWAKW